MQASRHAGHRRASPFRFLSRTTLGAALEASVQSTCGNHQCTMLTLSVVGGRWAVYLFVIDHGMSTCGVARAGSCRSRDFQNRSPPYPKSSVAFGIKPGQPGIYGRGATSIPLRYVGGTASWGKKWDIPELPLGHPRLAPQLTPSFLGGSSGKRTDQGKTRRKETGTRRTCPGGRCALW